MPWPDAAAWQQYRATANAAAIHWRPPLHRRAWRGAAGNWMGTGIGSSIDFQDHRPYLPGDDPRYLDWQAYARTGHYIMKLYREEVSPRLDLVLDVSESMFATPEKSARSAELFLFAAESAIRAGASLRAWTIHGAAVRLVENAALATMAPPGDAAVAAPAGVPALHLLPFRTGSLRIFVSDLLYPGDPEEALRPMSVSRGRAIVLAPFAADEAEPDWNGQFRFVDVESGTVRIQRVTPAIRTRYLEDYRRHMAMWSDVCRRNDAAMARMPVEGALDDVLRDHALPVEAVEPWN